MPYSITTKDGIQLNGIPDDIPPDDQRLKDRVAAERAKRGMEAPVSTPVAQPQPEDNRFVAEQLQAGAGKRLSEMGMGLRGAGLRAGAALGITSPEQLAQYEQEVARTRQVMPGMGPSGELSPEFRRFSPSTGTELLGGLGLDLASTYALGAGLKPVQAAAGLIPRIGPTVERGIQYGRQAITSPKTIPQAALGGALYSQTFPYESGQEAAGSAVLSSGMAGVAQPALRAMGLTPALESELPVAQQDAARRAVEAGFQFSPAQMTGSRTGMFIEEGIKALPLARGAFTKLENANQEALQSIAANAIGLKSGVPFTPQAMSDAYQNALAKYQSLQAVPSIKLDKAFGQQIDAILKDLKKVPETQRQQLGVPEVESVLEEYKTFVKNAIDGETMYYGLKALSDQLFTAQKSGKIGAGALKDLRNAFENAIERSITSPAKKGLVSNDVVKKFREGRTQMSNWFTVDEAFNPATGELSGPKLAGSLARKSNFGGRNTPLETAALAVRAFPRALPSSGTAERTEAAGAVKQMAQAAALPVLGAGAAGAYTQDPYAALMAAGAAQTLPALAARIATSEPVRSVVARRQLGAIAPDEGILARGMREFETRTPEAVRFGLGDLARLYAEQGQIRGLLGE